MAVDTLFNDVRLLLQSGSLTNAATSSPASVGSSGVTGGATLTFASDGIITASSVSLASPTALATLELVVTPTWDEYSKIASMLGVSLNAVSPGVIGIYSFATATPTLVGSLTTAQSGEITLIAEYLVSGGSTEIKLTAIPLTGSTTTTTVSAASAVGILPATLVLGGPPAIPVPVPGGSATVARVQAPRASYSQQQIASLRNTNPSNSIIYSSTPVSVTATAVGVSHTYTVSNPENRTVDDVLSELSLGISQLTGAVLMAETGYFTGAEQRASLRLTFTPISSDVDNWEYSFVGMPNATAIYFLTGVYGANPPLSQISTATFTFTPGVQSSVSLTAFGATTTGFTTDMPAFVAAVSSALSSLATVSGIYPFAGQCIIYVTGAIGVEFVMSSTLAADVTVPSGIATLRGARVTTRRRYIDLGAAVEYPALPWPTTSIPAGGGGSSDTNTLLLMHFDESSGTTLADETGRTFTTTDIATHTTASGKFSRGVFPASDTWDGAVGSSPVNISGGVFTIEFFVARRGSGATTAYEVVFAQTSSSSTWTDGLVVFVSGDNNLVQAYLDGIPTPGAIIGNTPGVWQHIALVRSGNGGTDTKWYVNGVGESGFATGYATHANVNPNIGNTAPSAGYRLNSVGIDELRISNVARYTADFTPPTAPFGIGGGALPADVWLALGFEGGSATDLSTYAHTKLTQDFVTLPTTGSRTSDGYAEVANGATVLNYSADLDELNGLTGLTIEFDFYIPTNLQSGYFFGPTGSVYVTADTTAGNGTVTITQNGWVNPLNGQGMTFSAGAWHHIAMVGGPTNCRYFVDGVEVGASGSGMTATNFSPNIGAETTLGILNISSRADLAVCAGMRLDNVLITKREKYTANFTPPGAISGGGTGWGTLPADVIFAVNAESNGNDVAQFGLSATASGTATIQASGSRTGDGYLRNTDSAQGADACFGYTPSAGFKSAWGAAQSMTLEFDIRVDTGAFLGGQILGIGSGYTALSGGGSTGSFLGGSPFATSAGSAELTVGAWHHIAFVADYNAGDRLIRTYRDGVQQGPAESVASFGFADYPNPTTIGLLQLYAGFIGNGALKGGLDNIVLTTRAKYTSTFTPGMTFAEIVGYTPPPSGVDVSVAGYNDLEAFAGTGTFNQQATQPAAYFFSAATVEDVAATGDAYTLNSDGLEFTSSRTLAGATNTGTFVSGTPQNFDSTVTLDDTTAVSTFYADTPVEWSGDSTLSDSTCFGIHALMAPSMLSGDSSSDDVMSSAAFGIIDPIYFRLASTVPSATLASSATQFFVNAQVPAATLLADVASYDGISLDANVPSVSLSSWMGMRLSSQLPRVTMLAETTVPNTLRLDATLPGITGQGNILPGRVFSVSSSVPAANISSWTGLQLAASVPTASSAGNVVVGGAFRVSPGLVPMATLAAGASSINVLRLNGAVPVASRAGWVAVNRNVPSARMLGSITPVVAVTRVAYSFTLSNSAMTRYPAYPFIQMIRMGNSYYGIGEDGLYELGGTTDNGVSIPWSWETCMADFGQAEKKTVVSAYLGGYVPQNMAYTIKAGDLPTGTNAHTTTATAVLRNHRQKFGIGRKSRFFAFGLSATQGRVAIESIEFELAAMSRRV